MGKVRIKDIAAIANVSIGTVDRVIHNRGGVNPATRARIQLLLQEHNYEPDIAASALALKKQLNLAVVMPGIVNGHAFWDLPRQGVERALQEIRTDKLQLEMIQFDQNRKSDFLNKVKDFPFQRIHGVLFAPVFHKESLEFIRSCHERSIPVVLINSLLDEEGVRSFVGQDAYQSGLVAARLINYGLEHRRDVVVVNMSARKDHYEHIISREKGFRAYFEQHHGHLDNLISADLNGANDRILKSELDSLFEKYRIGGLFVTNSRVYKVAEFLANRGAMGVRLVGYDLLPESIEYLRREYIDFLISQKPEDQAYEGFMSLFNMVAFGKMAPEKKLMPVEIITRENLMYYTTI